MIQAGADGILPVFATRNNRSNLPGLFIANNRFDFLVSIFPGDDDNFAHGRGPLKCAYRMRDDWFAGNCRKQFIETHALTGAGGDDDC
jgi:hypothetical protein